MLAAMLLAAALLADVEEVGPRKLPPGAAEEIRRTAASQGIEIRGVEVSQGTGFISMEMTLAYGPAAQRGTGLCRGAVYLVEPKETGSPKWGIVPLDRDEMRVSYAVTGAKCDGSVSPRVLVITGATPLADRDLLGILEAVRGRKFAPDVSQPRQIADRFAVDAVSVDPEFGQVTVLVSDRARNEALNVRLVKRGDAWFLSSVEGPPWED